MNRKIALGCGCLVIIVIALIGATIFGARHFFEKGKSWLTVQVEDSKQHAAVESAWQPPSLRPDANWFPAAVGAWTLRTSEDITSVPELQLDRPGRRGKYRGEKQDVEVIVVPVSAEEHESVFDRAGSALAEKGKHVISGGTDHSSYRIETITAKVTTRMGNRFYLKLNGEEHTRLWWMKDWLFIFRTTGPEDPDAFADKYLEAMKPAAFEK